jgi:hypothetical protein
MTHGLGGESWQSGLAIRLDQGPVQCQLQMALYGAISMRIPKGFPQMVLKYGRCSPAFAI